MIGIIVWLVVGGVVGWLASLLMRTDAQQGIILNIVVGIVGAFIAGLIIGGGSINQDITVESFLWSLLGAVVLLAIVNLIRRGSVRSALCKFQRGRPRGKSCAAFYLLQLEGHRQADLELLLARLDLRVRGLGHYHPALGHRHRRR